MKEHPGTFIGIKSGLLSDLKYEKDQNRREVYNEKINTQKSPKPIGSIKLFCQIKLYIFRTNCIVGKQ